MLEIVTATDIDELDGPLTARFELWMASFHVVLWALPLTLFLTEWSLSGREFWRAFFLALATGIVFGLLASILAHWSGQHRDPENTRRRIGQILANESPSVLPAPAEATARALCAVLVSDGRSAGGFLYVCPDSLVFQPHQPGPRRPWQRAAVGLSPVVLAPAGSLTLQRCWLLPRPWWKQPFFRRPRPVLKCSSADAAVILVTPGPDLLEPRLQAQIDDIRHRRAV